MTRNVPERIGACVVVAILVFFGILTFGAGNAVPAFVDFILAGLLTGAAIGRASRGRL